MMEEERLKYLVHRCLTKANTDDEHLELREMLLEGHFDTELTGLIFDFLQDDAAGSYLHVPGEDISEAILQSILTGEIPQQRHNPLAQRPRGSKFRLYKLQHWLAAASVLLLLIATFSYFHFNGRKRDHEAQPIAIQDTPPGRTGAILTLSNGTKLLLDSLHEGSIANQNGAHVMLKQGSVIYESSGRQHPDLAYNTMSTPNGREFHLQLPDGSGVWLNASSSITYPVAFYGQVRTVSVKGEAYFEVAKDENHPFVVKINDNASVEVLGTHFNINAYANEMAIKTTLTEGRVRVKSAGYAGDLTPGEQASINTAGHLSVSKNINIAQALAWRNGLFAFDGRDAKAVLEDIARWYDLRVVYEIDPQIQLKGKMQRNLSLSEALATLKDVGVNTRLEGQTLYIIR